MSNSRLALVVAVFFLLVVALLAMISKANKLKKENGFLAQLATEKENQNRILAGRNQILRSRLKGGG